MMEAVVDKKIDAHLIQQVNKMAGRNSNGANKYFKRLKLDYPTQETTRASRRFVKAMKKLPVCNSRPSFRKDTNILRRISYHRATRSAAISSIF